MLADGCRPRGRPLRSSLLHEDVRLPMLTNMSSVHRPVIHHGLLAHVLTTTTSREWQRRTRSHIAQAPLGGNGSPQPRGNAPAKGKPPPILLVRTRTIRGAARRSVRRERSIGS